MVPRGEAPAMIAEVETDVLPSLRIQCEGDGSVIESLPDPRMAVSQPVPFAHGAAADRGGPTVGGQGRLAASTRTSQPLPGGGSWIASIRERSISASRVELM